LLDCTFDLLARSDDPVLVHDFFLQCPSEADNGK